MKTNTYDMFNSIFAVLIEVFPSCANEKGYYNINEISKITKLDRIAVRKYLEIMEHLCIVNEITDGTNRYFQIDKYIKEKFKNKGCELLEEFQKVR